MKASSRCRRWPLLLAIVGCCSATALAQERAPRLPAAASTAEDALLPINLPTALQLASARPVDVLLASQRIEVAAAQLRRANALWLPTLYVGGDYFRHDGQLQDVGGRVFTTSKSSFLLGAGPSAVFAVTDALYAPLAARQVVAAREAQARAAVNDALLAVAESYFDVQQARGELAGALAAAARTTELVRRTEKLAGEIAPPVEAARARAELSRRRLAVEVAREHWRTAATELARLLRLPPSALVEPLEPPELQVALLDASRPPDELIPLALTNRPELAAQQALVQATLQRLRQERLRPLIPSVLLRGNATNPSGLLSSGYFGGGIDGRLSDFSARNSVDVQLLWELQNLGFGNRAAVQERKAENQLAGFELLQVQDRVAAEVVRVLAQARSAEARVHLAEAGLRDALESAEKNLAGLSQTRRIGEVNVLIIRPQEAVASVQALGQAYADFYGAVADANRAQFRLYRALGRPGQCILDALPQPAATLGPPRQDAP